MLYIAIVSDVNGLEICLVSSEAFEPAIAAAYNGVGPDYQVGGVRGRWGECEVGGR